MNTTKGKVMVTAVVLLMATSRFCVRAAETIDPPTPADLSWAADAPKSEQDCAAESTFWVRGGTRDPSRPPPTGTRQDPFPAMTAKGPTGLADVLYYSRSKAAPKGHICILIDVPNPEDKVGFGSWYTTPYDDAGIVTAGDRWTLIKKIGQGQVYIAPEPGTNPLTMGVIIPGSYYAANLPKVGDYKMTQAKLVMDGINIVSRWRRNDGTWGGDKECNRRAMIRLSLVSHFIMRNCLIYRNADASCDLHVQGGVGIFLTYARKILFENNVIAASASWHGQGYGSSMVTTFGTTEDVVFRNNYFHGADYDMKNRWDRMSRIAEIQERVKRMEFSGNVFSLARRVYDPRQAGRDALFYIAGDDIDFHHNIIVQRPFDPQTDEVRNYATVFFFERDEKTDPERISVRNNLFANVNGSLFFADDTPVFHLAFFNNVLVNSTKHFGDPGTFKFDWFPGFTVKGSGHAGPIAHDYNLFYAWDSAPANHMGTAASDRGYSSSWRGDLLFDKEPHSVYNTLHPGGRGIAQNANPFTSNVVDLSIADAGPISFRQWVEHFRPRNSNLNELGTARFYGTDYSAFPYNRDLDGRPMPVKNGRMAAGPFGGGK